MFFPWIQPAFGTTLLSLIVCKREIITAMTKHLEACPVCGQTSAVRTKLIMIDGAWIPGPNKDAREEYYSDLRVDAVQPQNLREHPLEQFIDGFYCNRCKKGFVSEEALKPDHKPYHR